MAKTWDQQMADMGVELTARDVLTDEELEEDWRLRRKHPSRVALPAAEDSEPPWL